MSVKGGKVFSGLDAERLETSYGHLIAADGYEALIEGCGVELHLVQNNFRENGFVPRGESFVEVGRREGMDFGLAS